MKKLAIVYHSGHGHTEHIARQVAEGARLPGIEVHVLQAEDAARRIEDLLAFDAIVLGSPTYLGGVSGPFKSFMDATGKLWRDLRLKGRLAAGFTACGRSVASASASRTAQPARRWSFASRRSRPVGPRPRESAASTR